MVIDPNPHEYFEDFKEAPLKLILDRAESCLMLCTTVDEIKKLSEMGKAGRDSQPISAELTSFCKWMCARTAGPDKIGK
jgi:hypothetical protein